MRALLSAWRLWFDLLSELRLQLPAPPKAGIAAGSLDSPVEATVDKTWREGLEDLLERVWLRREAGKDFQPRLYRPPVGTASTEQLVERLLADGLLRVKNGSGKSALASGIFIPATTGL